MVALNEDEFDVDRFLSTLIPMAYFFLKLIYFRFVIFAGENKMVNMIIIHINSHLIFCLTPFNRHISLLEPNFGQTFVIIHVLQIEEWIRGVRLSCEVCTGPEDEVQKMFLQDKGDKIRNSASSINPGEKQSTRKSLVSTDELMTLVGNCLQYDFLCPLFSSAVLFRAARC